MISIEYKDWFINQKHLPDRNSSEYKAFYDFHKELCKNGFLMEGEFINPLLYWHLNIWNTNIDTKDKAGRIGQEYTHPQLRDNEWILSREITRAEKEQKGLCIFGIRRFSKTTWESSYIAYGATFDENSENVIAGLNASDIKLVTDRVDKGLNRIPEAWQWKRVEDNWKNQVTLGIKTKENVRIPFSYILIRNLDDGTNQEAIAGTKPRRLVIDEGGKGPFLKALQAAIPGFTTPFGWGCSPLVFGTGGDMRKFQDAKSLFFDCDQYNFLDYPDESNHKRRIGLFIPAKYRMEAKEESTLGRYLNKPDGVLDDIPILISNEEKAIQITNDILTKLKKAGDRNAYLKEKMYYPVEVDDIFLNEDTNIFNIYAAKSQQERLRDDSIESENFFLKQTDDGIKLIPTSKMPISNFPAKGSDDKDAPVMIWEKPMPKPPFGLYVAGVDPYRQALAADSDSLGAVYILKRMHDIQSEKFQDMIVAAYVARPDDKDKWNEQARLLIKLYNARTLVENDEMSFIEYMKYKNDAAIYLEPQPGWLREVVPNTKVNREYGIHRSSEKVVDYLLGCLKEYLDEIIHIEKDEKGSIVRETPGVYRIRDTMLLQEIIEYNEDGNFDRIVAISLAIALANHLDSMGKVSTMDSDPRIAELFNKKKKSEGSGVFGSGGYLFKNTKSKLF